jgi:acyl carrier protein
MPASDHDPGTEWTTAWLRQQVAGMLHVDEREVPTDRPLGEMGIDSLTAAELSVEIEERTGATVPLEGFLGKRTLDDVARELARAAFAAGVDVTAP